MYKVFINDTPLFIHNRKDVKKQKINGIREIDPAETTPECLYEISARTDVEAMVYFTEKKATEYWSEWKKQFINIDAAGGMVIRSDRSFLGIYRMDKWDLPKGKADPGETPEVTALREVEEECGISGLEVVRKITDTFHIYPLRGDFVLKKTSWFLMSWNGSGELTPETEEGIEELRWFTKSDVETFCADTYGSVAEVVRAEMG